MGESVLTQQQFDRFVDDYNQDYLLVLKRASTRHYQCLVTSFSILKDFYDVLCTLYDNGGLVYHRIPYPFTVRADNQLLSQLGFTSEEIGNIYGFLTYVKSTIGVELEDYINKGEWEQCIRIGAP